MILYVDDILFIRNDVGMLSSMKAGVSKNVSINGLIEETYILGIYIYRDRWRRLFGLSQFMYAYIIVKGLAWKIQENFSC